MAAGRKRRSLLCRAAASDVLAGHVPLCIANIDSLMGQVSAGKLKPLATTGAKRAAVAPDTPTLVESVPAGTAQIDREVTTRSGTPAKIKDKLRSATERALQDAEVIASMRQRGFETGANLPIAEIDAFIKAEHKRWGEVIRAAGIKPE